MVKVYARLCENGSYNYYDDIKNSKKKSVSKLADDVKAQIEEDGYIILEDGTCIKIEDK